MKASRETIRAVLQEHKMGVTVTASARKHGLAPTQVNHLRYYWRNGLDRDFTFGVKDERRVQHCLDGLDRHESVMDWVPVDDDVPIVYRDLPDFKASDMVEVLSPSGVYTAFYGYRKGAQNHCCHWFMPDGKGCSKCVVAWRGI